MGLFSSRPYFSEVEEHIRYSTPVNDAYFYEAKMLEAEEKKRLLEVLRDKKELGYKAAEEYCGSLKGQISRAQERLDHISEETQAKLVMEIRKGIDLQPFGFIRIKGLYVRVKTAPMELSFRTTLSQPYIPKWYHVAHLPYPSSSSLLSASLTIYCVGSNDQEVAIASLDIDLREAINSVQTRWHACRWNWPYEGTKAIPQLEIRYWNAKDLEAFWMNIKAKTMGELEEIEQAVENSRPAQSEEEEKIEQP